MSYIIFKTFKTPSKEIIAESESHFGLSLAIYRDSFSVTTYPYGGQSAAEL